jgi:hypothetical protein
MQAGTMKVGNGAMGLNRGLRTRGERVSGAQRAVGRIKEGCARRARGGAQRPRGVREAAMNLDVRKHEGDRARYGEPAMEGDTASMLGADDTR